MATFNQAYELHHQSQSSHDNEFQIVKKLQGPFDFLKYKSHALFQNLKEMH